LCRSHGEPGIQLFVYGASGAEKTRPSRFPARQTLEASQAIARLHGLDPKRTFFAQQNPEAIDAGVFHNDVIAVGHRHVFFHHAQAFVDTSGLIDDLKRRFEQSCGAALHAIEVQVRDVSLSDAVETYLFNSQLIDTPDGKMALICPHECKNHKSVGPYLAALASSRGPISAVQFVNVRQSMQNGGGPACLRLRVVLTESQLSRMRQGVLLTNELHDQLQHWVRRHYRDNIAAKDLSDPNLAEESRAALDELSGILRLGSIYAFQR
jgi:succinylarginine dihydrolase